MGENCEDSKVVSIHTRRFCRLPSLLLIPMLPPQLLIIVAPRNTIPNASSMRHGSCTPPWMLPRCLSRSVYTSAQSNPYIVQPVVQRLPRSIARTELTDRRIISLGIQFVEQFPIPSRLDDATSRPPRNHPSRQSRSFRWYIRPHQSFPIAPSGLEIAIRHRFSSRVFYLSNPLPGHTSSTMTIYLCFTRRISRRYRRSRGREEGDARGRNLDLGCNLRSRAFDLRKKGGWRYRWGC